MTTLEPALLGISVFFNDTATTEIYTLSLHDALPISAGRRSRAPGCRPPLSQRRRSASPSPPRESSLLSRSEEHTSELQSTSISRMPSSASNKNHSPSIIHLSRWSSLLLALPTRPSSP